MNEPEDLNGIADINDDTKLMEAVVYQMTPEEIDGLMALSSEDGIGACDYIRKTIKDYVAELRKRSI